MKSTIQFWSRCWLFAGLVCTTFYAQGQDKWNISIKGGLAVPTHDLGQTEIKMGFGYEGVLGFQFAENFTVLAGWSHHFFPSDDLFAGLDLDFEETGYSAGVLFTYPSAADEVRYSIGAGLLYHHIEAENAGGDIIADSGHELGFQIESMIGIPLSHTLSLIPYVRYRTLDTDITVDEVTIPTVLSSIGVGTGIKWMF